LDSAIRKVGGKIDNKDTFRSALKLADFKSVAGPFRFNNNHFPIRNYYRVEVARDASGQAALVNKGVVLKDYPDRLHAQCEMK
jgi:branched-chain amino acid transport system substrate-binding protein